jgi:hypothetical protein
MTRTRRWTEQEERKGYWGSAASLEAVRDSSRGALDAIGGSVSLSGDYGGVAMRERTAVLGQYTKNISDMEKVLAAVDVQLYSYASDVYVELRFSEIQASLFE